ncbi:hypothetical protein SCLCIDRAFT_16923 [Scleroderma citrinum Foug A]|uniref:Uncharacterized protein n=1 Tax=Scleroderma citrinum Foug A TaxID=1036808 RepID=A0A0C3DA78_9AGAM|nr:hypothetical protein SCLCIDRAFT_16923 [Scleroderma citrinum Foug A]
MDFFLGCPTKIRPEGDQAPRVCPRCNNAAMFAAKSRTWFEFCFVPLIPMRTKHIWMCGICQLQTQMQPGWEPAIAQPGYQHPNMQQGYQPGYIRPK